MSISREGLEARLAFFQGHGLITSADSERLHSLFADRFAFRSLLQAADSLHLHFKVDDAAALPEAEILAQGAVSENAKPGYVKYAHANGIHFIFSSIDISQDDRLGLPQPARPFLDHFGIDLRQESAVQAAAFDGIPAQAERLGWETAAQGGGDQPVFCCHVQVKAKHWVYPTSDADLPPIEFAYGPLTISADKSGCDLRPARPSVVAQHKAESGCAPKACG